MFIFSNYFLFFLSKLILSSLLLFLMISQAIKVFPLYFFFTIFSSYFMLTICFPLFPPLSSSHLLNIDCYESPQLFKLCIHFNLNQNLLSLLFLKLTTSNNNNYYDYKIFPNFSKKFVEKKKLFFKTFFSFKKYIFFFFIKFF